MSRQLENLKRVFEKMPSRAALRRRDVASVIRQRSRTLPVRLSSSMPAIDSLIRRWSVAVWTALALVLDAPAVAQPAAVTASAVAQDIVSLYLVTVQGEARQRKLQILTVRDKSLDAFQAEGRYGWADAALVRVQVEVTRTPAALSLRFTTPTTALVVADRQPDGSFAGTISLKNGTIKPVVLRKISEADVAVTGSAAPGKTQVAGTGPVAGAVSGERVRFIHMGGNDCPPCVAWRGLELQKLEKSPTFKAIRYSYVVKAIRSPVPAEVFLPDELKQLKARLDHASAGKARSPHQVLIVDGEVYDYWIGALDASEIEAKIAAITGGTPYPGTRCKTLGRDIDYRACAEPH